MYISHLRIKPSTVQNAGKGLFAVNPSDKTGDAIVFRKDQDIIRYFGAPSTGQETYDRYGDALAPYTVAINVNQGLYEDAACQRGVGSLANHATQRNSNARFKIKRATSTRPAVIMVTATKNIRNGHEIFINYGREYWRVHRQHNDIHRTKSVSRARRHR
jgi:hypothetical protein